MGFLFEGCYFGAIMGSAKKRLKLNVCKNTSLYSIRFPRHRWEGFVFRRFHQLRSYQDNTESWNWKEISFSSRIVLRGLSVVEVP